MLLPVCSALARDIILLDVLALPLGAVRACGQNNDLMSRHLGDFVGRFEATVAGWSRSSLSQLEGALMSLRAFWPSGSNSHSLLYDSNVRTSTAYERDGKYKDLLDQWFTSA